jgi:hypothetical protein
VAARIEPIFLPLDGRHAEATKSKDETWQYPSCCRHGSSGQPSLRVEARTSLEERFKDKIVGDDVIRDEEAYHKLFHALRDAEPDANGLHGRFCDTVDELRQALVLPEAQRLTSEYEKYLKDEFPQVIEDAH